MSVREDAAALAALLERVRRSAGDQELTHEQLAERVLDMAWTMPSGGWDALLPAVLWYVREAERARVREAERAVFPLQREEYANPAEESMRRLLKERVYIPGHGMVPWGEMTVEFHEARIAFIASRMAAYLDGQKALIRRHKAASVLLRQHGCTDLNEYVTRFGAVPGEVNGEATANVEA